MLDLRNGGAADRGDPGLQPFVPDGTIVSTSGRTQRDRTFEATGDALPRHRWWCSSTAILASASEIVAAALEQAGYATVVGTRSFGKGTFQEVIPLDNGGALDLTVGEYLTRDGTSINGTGIKPQVRAKDVPPRSPTRRSTGPPGAGPAALRRVVLVSKRALLVGELLFERGGESSLAEVAGRRIRVEWRWSSSAWAAVGRRSSASSAIRESPPT